MTTPLEAMERLDDQARELDQLSRDLASVERKLEPARREYEDFLAAHEIGLWNSHIVDDTKLPPIGLRQRMALKEMPSELRGRHDQLMASRDRIEQRIRDLKAAIEAQRSILSALKLEMEASGA